MFPIALAVSTAFIGICSLLAHVGRSFVEKLIKPGLVQELLYEAIAAAELCACCFELIIGK